MLQYGLKENDIILISSILGRKSIPIELAIKCKELGMSVIAFTNLKHSKSVSSRHSPKQKLYELCNYVIDNCGEVGDVMMLVEDTKGKMGSNSSIVGMYMAQLLSMLLAQNLAKADIELPVFLSEM